MSIFERAEIDYSCQGHRTIAEVASDAGYSAEELIARLEWAADTSTGPDWFTAPLGDVVAYLESEHTDLATVHIPNVREAIQAVTEIHDQIEEIGRIRIVFDRLANDLTGHVLKEEREFFPAIRTLERTSMPNSRIAQRVLRELVEHETFRDRLLRLRHLAARLPDGPAVLRLRNLLLTLSREVHHHMHIENNILYPRAIDLEKETG